MTPSVRALFFARYREIVGSGGVEVDLTDATTVGEFVRSLRARGHPFDLLPPDPAVAVNREVAEPSVRVNPGDEIAFLPPVAGG